MGRQLLPTMVENEWKLAQNVVMLAKVPVSGAWSGEAKDTRISPFKRCHTDVIHGRVFVKFTTERRFNYYDSSSMWLYSVTLSDGEHGKEVVCPLARVVHPAQCDITPLFCEALIDFGQRHGQRKQNGFVIPQKLTKKRQAQIPTNRATLQ
eukprot:c5581_g1_i3.p1 GENE.c5581_g1_i3~~c5581_g1_i3.p1  ORF type:complete len:151 (+),score=24.71 c5581_g1_i3:1-453(+)